VSYFSKLQQGFPDRLIRTCYKCSRLPLHPIWHDYLIFPIQIPTLNYIFKNWTH